MQYRPEPSYHHGQPVKTGVVLINLGTPEAPTPSAVRRYLKQFLSDPRVVEIPRFIWWIILRAFILPFRSSQSAHKYAAIWDKEGSPLMVHTVRQGKLLQGYLGERGYQLEVAHAMRYGEPSIPAVMRQLRESGCERVLILPAYPQYSATTTASIGDAVADHFTTVRNVPELRYIRHYHDHPAYIEALANGISAYWQSNGRPDVLLMSFHGIPKRSLTLGDPYHCECLKTGRLLAERLGLSMSQYRITFQSRFGRARWLEPYTAPTLQELGKQGVKRVDVTCPGFVSDCLETLEEIAIEGKSLFLAAGGTSFHHIPCMNESPAWIHGMCDIVEQHLSGWHCRRLNDVERRERDDELAVSRELAIAAGAVD